MAPGSANASDMIVAPAHILLLLFSVLALVRELPEVMSTVAEILFWFWAYCRFIR